MPALPLTRATLKALPGEARRVVVTLFIALATGYAFLRVGMPAPFMMGSLLGVWFIGAAVRPLREQIGVARWFHIPVMLVLGVLIGSNFTIATIGNAAQWSVTMAAMIVATVIATGLGYLHLRASRGYSRQMAFLCTVPGGLTEVVVLARELVREDYAVALFHLIRITLVFLVTPLILAYLLGGGAVAASNATLEGLPGIMETEPLQAVAFVAIAGAGYYAAKLVRLPVPHLLGPALLSSALHISGVVEIPRVQELVVLAQLVIGGAVGSRLAKVRFQGLLGYMRDGLMNTMIVLAVYLFAAFGMAGLLGVDELLMWLAFVPGGVYEITLLALLFGFDLAFVAFHHTTRVLLVYFALAFVAARPERAERQERTPD